MSSPEEKQEKIVRPIPEGTILVGNKPIMRYIITALTILNRGSEKLIIKARGRAISKAVSIAEILRKKMLPRKLEIANIEIKTEKVGTENRDISAIEIILTHIKDKI